MKKHNLLIALAVCLGLVFTSCSKDDHDHESGCHDCHLEIMMADGTEDHNWDIGEYCGDALADVEANGYTLTEETEYMGVTYEVGHVFADVHCEDHGDHDDDGK